MSVHTAGGRALFIGKGLLGLGTAHSGTQDPGYSVDAYHDDPVRGVVRFFPGPVPASSLTPWAIADGLPGAGALAIVGGPWSAFTFGSHNYDPFGSLGESLARAAGPAPAEDDDGGRWKPCIAAALWAAMEGDLYRFAFDMPFIRELEAHRESAEWKRFAGLNDLYRACIRAMVPFGIAPADWSSWLRGSEEAAGTRTGLHCTLERLLTRPVDAITRAVAAHTTSGGIFSIPTFDRVET